jgi:hypothetical protein
MPDRHAIPRIDHCYCSPRQFHDFVITEMLAQRLILDLTLA